MKGLSIFRAILLLSAGVGLLSPNLALAVRHQVSIQNYMFIPNGLHVTPGDTIVWTNRDPVQHTSTSDQLLWDSGLLFPDQSYSVQFARAGSYPYHCAMYHSMHDTIFVYSPSDVNEAGPVPEVFELGANYPNPFNARTRISFSLNIGGHAILEVFNLQGQRVVILENSLLDPGIYTYLWDAGGEPSGIFFYRLSFNGRVKTGRMILLK